MNMVISRAGYVIESKLADTLQGSIYRSIQQSTKNRVVITSANIRLHSQCIAKIGSKHYKVNENFEAFK